MGLLKNKVNLIILLMQAQAQNKEIKFKQNFQDLVLKNNYLLGPHLAKLLYNINQNELQQSFVAQILIF